MRNQLVENLFNLHETYKVSEIQNKRFSHSDLINALNKFENSDLINISTAGYSAEGRTIQLVKIGYGKINVMAWSQMHGDESTATMALLDFFNFLTSVDKQFADIKKNILDKITLYILPMLNPDGTEKFKRNNSLDIDINRDAVRLQAPESKILKAIQEKTRPSFAFNLHDQATRYTVGDTSKVATIAFLAPAYNHKKEINSTRKNAMKLISVLATNLQQFISGHIAKYNDDFEPRAFGDNFVKWGSSLVLIESGGWKNNHVKSFLRKLNFVALISAFNSIATGSYLKATTDVYDKIPQNKKRLFDLLLRNITIRKNGKKYLLDIGINQNETGTKNERDYFFTGQIEEVGDLSVYYGFEEIDCNGMELKYAKIYPSAFNNLEEISENKIIEILKNGYSFIKVNEVNNKSKYTKLPINIIQSTKPVNTEIKTGAFANFIITQNDKLKYVCVNGFLFNSTTADKNNILNGLIYNNLIY